jgi:hypothetical protein
MAGRGDTVKSPMRGMECGRMVKKREKKRITH